MWLLLKLAWRNLFRNTRRTLLSGLAIGVGLAALIFGDAYMLGMMESMVQTATATFPGEAQIHRRGFRKSLDVELTIAGSGRVLKELAQEPLVKSFAPRVLSYGMLTSPADVSSILLYGVDPEREAGVSQLKQSIVSGGYLEPGSPNEILVGEQLAKNLDLSVGDRAVVTVAQAGTGDLSQEMFRVGGIFKFSERTLDDSVAFVHLGKAQQLLALGDGVHEIALDFTDLRLATDEKLPFWKKYSQNGNEALGWGKIFPDLKSFTDMTNFAMLITALILFGVVSFGIMNTLFMSLYERMFEFGVMRAVGTRPARLAFMVLFEACSLALISIVIGILLGWALTRIYMVVGIDYRGLEFSGVTIKDMLYPVMRLYQYVVYPIWLFLFTAVVGLYPAIYAARLKPAKAMKRSM